MDGMGKDMEGNRGAGKLHKGWEGKGMAGGGRGGEQHEAEVRLSWTSWGRMRHHSTIKNIWGQSGSMRREETRRGALLVGVDPSTTTTSAKKTKAKIAIITIAVAADCRVQAAPDRGKLTDFPPLVQWDLTAFLTIADAGTDAAR